MSTSATGWADLIEWDQERTGRRQEGAFAGLASMSTKIATAATMLLVGPLMNWIGYVSGGRAMSSGAAENLRRLFALAPFFIYMLSALAFSRYSITRESHRLMRERLATRDTTSARRGREMAGVLELPIADLFGLADHGFAPIRLLSSSNETSSLCVETRQMCPNGSSNLP